VLLRVQRPNFSNPALTMLLNYAYLDLLKFHSHTDTQVAGTSLDSWVHAHWVVIIMVFTKCFWFFRIQNKC